MQSNSKIEEPKPEPLKKSKNETDKSKKDIKKSEKEKNKRTKKEKKDKTPKFTEEKKKELFKRAKRVKTLKNIKNPIKGQLFKMKVNVKKGNKKDGRSKNLGKREVLYEATGEEGFKKFKTITAR